MDPTTESGARVTPRMTRLERFRVKHDIGPLRWSMKAGITRQSFDRVRDGNDTHLSTIRAIVRAVSEIVGRQVHVRELFEVGEDTPISEVLITRRVVAAAHRKQLKRYPTRIDRILRGEGLVPSDFAYHVGIGAVALRRFRVGEGEPSLLTLASIVRTLRLMTGKPYVASHLYDVGEGLTDLRKT